MQFFDAHFEVVDIPVTYSHSLADREMFAAFLSTKSSFGCADENRDGERLMEGSVLAHQLGSCSAFADANISESDPTHFQTLEVRSNIEFETATQLDTFEVHSNIKRQLAFRTRKRQPAFRTRKSTYGCCKG